MTDEKAGNEEGEFGPMITRRHALMGGLLFATACTGYMRQPQVVYPVIDSDVFRSWIPENFGDWSNTGSGDLVLPPPDALSERLYDNLITLVYRNSAREEVMVLLAYNNRQDGMLQVHRPEVCYPVGGFDLTETKANEMLLEGRAIPASEFTASNSRRVEHVSYFTRVGDEFPRTWAQQRLAVLEANLAGKIPDGMMVRVSSLQSDRQKAFDDMRAFTTEFFRASPPALRKLLTR